jgi:transposase
MQRELGVTCKTAWRMCNLIRYMGYVEGNYPLGGPGKAVEGMSHSSAARTGLGRR